MPPCPDMGQSLAFPNMKQILLMIAVVMGQTVLAADKKPLTKEESAKVIEAAIRKAAKKPTGELTKADLAKVTLLSLDDGPKITDAGLKEVAKLQQLKVLNLGDTEITDAGLKEVAKCTQLTFLDLEATQITDAGLKEVAKLQQLTHLWLYNTQITDAGLKELGKLQKLELLVLGHTQITDAGLKELAKFKQLKGLVLDGTKITVENAAELQKALPKCRISHTATK